MAGYIARSIQKSLKCKSCCLLSTGETLQAQIEEGESSSEIIKARDEFLISMSRGGLLKPTDIFYLTCIHASGLFQLLRENGQLFKFQNPHTYFRRYLHTCIHLRIIVIPELKRKINHRNARSPITNLILNLLYYLLYYFKQKLTEKNNTACILDDKCKDGHSFQSVVEKISMSMFNIMSNNVVTEMNREIKHFKFKERPNDDKDT